MDQLNLNHDLDTNSEEYGEKSKQLCDGCSKCCEYFALEIDTPETEDEFQNIRWYLLHEKVKLFITEEIDEDDETPEGEEVEVTEHWFLQIYNPCKKLAPDGKCSIYSTRPEICKDHSHENCEKYGAADDEIASFTDAEAFWKWAVETYDFIDENPQ